MQLSFKVDSEWLCNFIRTRVYYEGVPFLEGLKLLKESFKGIEDSDALAILTGTKIIHGINGGELVEDNKLQDYLNYLKRQQDKGKQFELETDIQLHPLNYIDPFAAEYSYKKFKDKCSRRGIEPNYAECEEWFCDLSTADDYLFQGGMYSVSTEFTKEIVTDGTKEEFYEYLYDYWQNRLEEDSSLTEADKQRIRLRQRSYELYKKKREDVRTIEEKYAEYKASKDSIRAEEALSEEVIDGTYTLPDCLKKEQRTAKYIPLEEGIYSRYGIITPKGEFYACIFGNHKYAAAVVCLQKKYLSFDIDEIEKWDEAKDLLYDRGYVFVNTIGADTFFSKYASIEDMPQTLMNACYDWIILDRQR